MDLEIFQGPIRIRRAVLSFTGWPDAGETIQQTFKELERLFPCELVARLDMDGFWHTESSRPQVSIQHGRMQSIEWPSYYFFLSHFSSCEPILLGTGPEPGFRWRAFAHEFLQILTEWGCQQIFLLGSLYDQIFHDEVLFSSVVQDPTSFNLVRELGCQRIEYTGPGAIQSSIMEVAHRVNLQCTSIWAHIPFYLSGPHQLVMAHCLQILGMLLGLEVDTRHLLQRWQERVQEIENLIQEDPDLRRLLENIRGNHSPGKPRSVFVASKVIQLDEFLKRRQQNPHPE